MGTDIQYHVPLADVRSCKLARATLPLHSTWAGGLLQCKYLDDIWYTLGSRRFRASAWRESTVLLH